MESTKKVFIPSGLASYSGRRGWQELRPLVVLVASTLLLSQGLVSVLHRVLQEAGGRATH